MTDRPAFKKLEPHEAFLREQLRQDVSYSQLVKLLKERGVHTSVGTLHRFFNRPETTAGPTPEAKPHAVPKTVMPEPYTPKGTPPAAAPPDELARLMEENTALRAELRALQDTNTALQAEVVSLTEQRPSTECQLLPGAGLPVPVYSGSWEGDMSLLPGKAIDIPPAPRVRILQRAPALALAGLFLAFCLLAFCVSWQGVLARVHDAALRSPHLPFALLEAALLISGLGIGLRAKALVPALLALITYLLMLHRAPLPFFIALLLTLQVGKALVRDR